MTSVAVGALPEMGFSDVKSKKFNGKRILFQGDSITDAGRNKELSDANTTSALGAGYVALTAANLLSNTPERGYEVFNKGISGHKVFQLIDRWQADTFDMKPDLVSILIGVNDFWHTLSHGYTGTPEVYRDDFRKLLDSTKEKLPNATLIIGEPFIAKGGTAITDAWYPAFSKYQEISKEMAKEYNTAFVPFQAYFDEALTKAPASYWCPDGVHPSLAGSALMSAAWLETFKKV